MHALPSGAIRIAAVERQRLVALLRDMQTEYIAQKAASRYYARRRLRLHPLLALAMVPLLITARDPAKEHFFCPYDALILCVALGVAVAAAELHCWVHQERANIIAYKIRAECIFDPYTTPRDEREATCDLYADLILRRGVTPSFRQTLANDMAVVAASLVRDSQRRKQLSDAPLADASVSDAVSVADTVSESQ
jgi:hypothetical protein